MSEIGVPRFARRIGVALVLSAALGPLAPAPAQAALRSCSQKGFVDTDKTRYFYKLRVSGVACSSAVTVPRAIGAFANRDSGGNVIRYIRRKTGYSCDRIALPVPGAPTADWRCAKGAKRVQFLLQTGQSIGRGGA